MSVPIKVFVWIINLCKNVSIQTYNFLIFFFIKQFHEIAFLRPISNYVLIHTFIKKKDKKNLKLEKNILHHERYIDWGLH